MKEVALLDQPLPRIFELVTFRSELPAAPGAALPADPGGLRRRGDGRIDVMHIAPERWLICDPPGPFTAAVPAAGYALVDVTGKWLEFQLNGAGAAQLLASTVDIEGLLRHRDCLQTYLFDCPGIVAANPPGYVIFVPRSYGPAFRSAVVAAAAF
jgi:hypothetical protein